MKPHIRLCAPGVWQCTASRSENHIMRGGVAAESPSKALEVWLSLTELVDPVQLGINLEGPKKFAR